MFVVGFQMDGVLVVNSVIVLPEGFVAVSAEKVLLPEMYHLDMSTESCFATKDFTT